MLRDELLMVFTMFLNESWNIPDFSRRLLRESDIVIFLLASPQPQLGFIFFVIVLVGLLCRNELLKYGQKPLDIIFLQLQRALFIKYNEK